MITLVELDWIHSGCFFFVFFLGKKIFTVAHMLLMLQMIEIHRGVTSAYVLSFLLQSSKLISDISPDQLISKIAI